MNPCAWYVTARLNAMLVVASLHCRGSVPPRGVVWLVPSRTGFALEMGWYLGESVFSVSLLLP